jgi:hypothetical protein
MDDFFGNTIISGMGEKRNARRILWRSMEERDRLEKLAKDGKVILNTS